jgi:ABC-type Co2+ transport system permease subunit
MLRPGAAADVRFPWRDAFAAAVLVLSVLVCAAAIALESGDQVNSLSAILGAAAVAAGLLSVGERGGTVGVSGAFIVGVLAAALLGPASAVVAVVIAELAATAVMRTRWRAVVLINLAPAIVAAVGAAVIIRAMTSGPADDASFYLAVALAAAIGYVVSFLMFAGLRRLVFPEAEQVGLSTLIAYLPTGGLSILVAVAGVGIYFKVG